MKAITIWQPWASLIVLGAKPFEFRRWPAPASIVGQRIVIHAGARPVKRAEVADLIQRLRRGREDGTGLIVEPALEMLNRVHLSPGILPLSAGLGSVILGKPRRPSKIFSGAVSDSDRIDEHIWAWPLSDIERFEPMVPARGAQGFWDWSKAAA